MAKVERMTANGETEILHAFHCPACEISHAVRTAASKEGIQVWKFNGDLSRPTFYPSIGNVWNNPDEGGKTTVCHAVIEDGRIRYLTDCTHKLAGKTVELPDL